TLRFRRRPSSRDQQASPLLVASIGSVHTRSGNRMRSSGQVSRISFTLRRWALASFLSTEKMTIEMSSYLRASCTAAAWVRTEVVPERRPLMSRPDWLLFIIWSVHLQSLRCSSWKNRGVPYSEWISCLNGNTRLTKKNRSFRLYHRMASSHSEIDLFLVDRSQRSSSRYSLMVS